jgi:hypothetical protein
MRLGMHTACVVVNYSWLAAISVTYCRAGGYHPGVKALWVLRRREESCGVGRYRLL